MNNEENILDLHLSIFYQRGLPEVTNILSLIEKTPRNQKYLSLLDGWNSGLGIRSFNSNQMSNCERFAQITQDK